MQEREQPDNKCMRCKVIALKLLKPPTKYYQDLYPNGVCRKCKRLIILELRRVLKDDTILHKT